jgi:hypothetical protein
MKAPSGPRYLPLDIQRNFPLLVTPLSIDEVSQFVYIDITVDPALTYDLHYTKILRTIHMSTNHFMFAREATPSLHTHSVMILYHLWVSTVVVHALSMCTPTSFPYARENTSTPSKWYSTPHSLEFLEYLPPPSASSIWNSDSPHSTTSVTSPSFDSTVIYH